MRKYKKIKIRAGGNRKTDRNILDTVRGCIGAKVIKGGCYGQCYAAKMAKVSGVDFSHPVACELDPTTLRRSLKRVDEPWIRIGVSGDPSLEWGLTLRVADYCREADKIPVVITKGWHKPTDTDLWWLQSSGAVLHVSLSALDGRRLIKQRRDLMHRYKDKGGTVVCRLITSAFTGEFGGLQSELITWCRDRQIPILETPLRFFRTNPYYLSGVIDSDKVKPHISPFTGKTDGALSAGRLIGGSPFTTGYCDTTCNQCPNQCWTVRFDPRSLPIKGLVRELRS